jgi:hypothetical protein
VGAEIPGLTAAERQDLIGLVSSLMVIEDYKKEKRTD